MKRIKVSENFYADEYIPRELYVDIWHKPWVVRGLIDYRLIEADQKLRSIFGATQINTWWNGGENNASGLRLPTSKFYSNTSQHTFGRASDKHFLNYTAEEVQEYVKKHWKELGIYGLELGVSWVHTDVRWNGYYQDPRNELKTFNPS